MKIIISPAKKMKADTDFLPASALPAFLDDSQILLSYLKGLSYDQAKNMWQCSDNIAHKSFLAVKDMDLFKNLTPAVFAYEGIQYQYMAPSLFDSNALKYIDSHLRILSAFYGILSPFDGICPYRLEMKAKISMGNIHSMYDFWDDKIARYLFSQDDCIINLASAEYSKCISKYITKDIRLITCVFGTLHGGKVLEKGTYAKMARGEMVRFLAENSITQPQGIKDFNHLNYSYNNELSTENTYVFLKKEN